MTIGDNTLSGERLRSYVERIEAIRALKKTLAQDEAVIMAEAKIDGLIPAVIRHCVKIRAMKPHDRQEMETLRDTYLHALGLGDAPPLFRALAVLADDAMSRERIVEAIQQFVPVDGDIIMRLGGPALRLWRDRGGTAHADEWVEPVEAGRSAAGKQGHVVVAAASIPDVDEVGAETLGEDFARDNRPVIDNPFPFGDPRRPRFDAGWRHGAGSDGMGPPGGEE